MAIPMYIQYIFNLLNYRFIYVCAIQFLNVVKQPLVPEVLLAQIQVSTALYDTYYERIQFEHKL